MKNTGVQKQQSGGKRMALAGRKPILLGPTVEQKKIIDAAARAEGLPTTQFILHHVLAHAKKILLREGKSA